MYTVWGKNKQLLIEDHISSVFTDRGRQFPLDHCLPKWRKKLQWKKIRVGNAYEPENNQSLYGHKLTYIENEKTQTDAHV